MGISTGFSNRKSLSKGSISLVTSSPFFCSCNSCVDAWNHPPPSQSQTWSVIIMSFTPSSNPIQTVTKLWVYLVQRSPTCFTFHWYNHYWNSVSCDLLPAYPPQFLSDFLPSNPAFFSSGFVLHNWNIFTSMHLIVNFPLLKVFISYGFKLNFKLLH